MEMRRVASALLMLLDNKMTNMMTWTYGTGPGAPGAGPARRALGRTFRTLILSLEATAVLCRVLLLPAGFAREP